MTIRNRGGDQVTDLVERLNFATLVPLAAEGAYLA